MSWKRALRRTVRWTAWTAGYVLGLVALTFAGAWVWWQEEPKARGTEVNALWVQHKWVEKPQSEAEYRRLGELMLQNKITDAYFHTGPFQADGSVPPAKYARAGDLVKTMRKYAPGVRMQAYLGQIRKVDGRGITDIDVPAVRDKVLETDRIFLDLGFDGIHYDFEPIYPDDRAFLALLDRTRELTRSKGKLLSVALEQPTLVDAFQPVYKALIPRGWGAEPIHYPPRPTEDYLKAVADRVDQVAIMTYDTPLLTESMIGFDYARHTENVLRLIGDRTTVFMGVPTYRPLMDWSEKLQVALKGVRRGVDALDRAPRKPFGVGVYAEWTTEADEWALYRSLWLPSRADNFNG